MTMESYCFKKEVANALLHESWIEEYIRYAENCPDLLYGDPDETHTDGKSSAFYLRLVSFLSKREDLLKERLKGDWIFEMRGPIKGNEKPSGIEVFENGKAVMYLRSDQFGFSAPKAKMFGNHRYPYIKYLEESTNCHRYRQIAEWIWKTRTIGGSFFWPLQKLGNWQSLYNRDRGIGCRNRGWCYIQDRVDLTLFEVMKFFDNNLTAKDVLFKEINRNPYMKLWLGHFGSFETYVAFFMFEDFVCKNEEGKLVPKNIINGEPLTEEYVNGVKSQGGVIQNLSANEIENMLNNVSNWTLERTKKIEKLLNCENNAGGNT